MTRALAVTWIAFSLLLLAGCPSGDRESASSAPSKSTQAPRWEELRGATFLGLEESAQPVTLGDGRWEGAPFGEGGASRPTIELAKRFRLTGDLDGDGAEEAVVLLSGGSGGSGRRSYLAVVGRRDDRLANLGTAMLGDRVQLREGRIEGRRILLDLVQAGPADAACCPGELVTRTFELSGKGLSEPVPPVSTGRLGLDTLAGRTWVLKAWNLGEPAPEAPEVTLQVEDARLVGSSGCNTFSAGASAGEQPGDLVLGPVVSTRKSCPPPEMEVESRFLGQLGGARRFGFLVGRLAVTCEANGALGTLLFEEKK